MSNGSVGFVSDQASAQKEVLVVGNLQGLQGFRYLSW